jgi:hypothetical protein
LAYSDDDTPSVYENGLSQKENLNFLHLNRYVSQQMNVLVCKFHKNEIFFFKNKVKDAS